MQQTALPLGKAQAMRTTLLELTGAYMAPLMIGEVVHLGHALCAASSQVFLCSLLESAADQASSIACLLSTATGSAHKQPCSPRTVTAAHGRLSLSTAQLLDPSLWSWLSLQAMLCIQPSDSSAAASFAICACTSRAQRIV